MQLEFILVGNRIATRVPTKKSINTKTESGNYFCIRNFRNLWLWQPCLGNTKLWSSVIGTTCCGFPKMKIVLQMVLTVLFKKKGRVMQDKSCHCYRVKLIIIGNMFYSCSPCPKSLKHLCTSLFPCNLLRCYCKVAWLQQHCKREGEIRREQNFSKVFQGFCLRLRLATTWKTQKLVPSKKISEQQHFLF